MNRKKTILYVGNFSFPYGNAAGKRVYANGKILKQLGYEVIYIGMDKALSGSEPLKRTKKKYNGFLYYNFPYPRNNLDWIKYKKTYQILIHFLYSSKLINHLSLIIYYGSPNLSLFNTKLIHFCKTHNIKVVTDSVDWLTTKTNNFAFDIIKWADNTYQMVYANRKTNGVIAVSSYLANYYKKRGCFTVTIPTLFAVDDILLKQELTPKDKKVITYAGLPFRKGEHIKNCNTLKDRIDKTIIMFCYAKQMGCEFIFHIYGITKDEYLSSIPEQKDYVIALGESISFHGLSSSEQVVDGILNSDFTILIRDVNRDTTAGFPTKFSESIGIGTPVITTRTSDIAEYLVEGKNGFFLDFDEETAKRQLVECLSIDSSSMIAIKNYCAEHNPFYYMNYVDKMKEFLKGLRV